MIWLLVGIAIGGMIAHWQDSKKLKVTQVHLVKEGHFAVVYATINGNEIEVMREVAESPFSHTVSESGLAWRLTQMSALMSAKRKLKHVLG